MCQVAACAKGCLCVTQTRYAVSNCYLHVEILSACVWHLLVSCTAESHVPAESDYLLGCLNMRVSILGHWLLAGCL